MTAKSTRLSVIWAALAFVAFVIPFAFAQRGTSATTKKDNSVYAELAKAPRKAVARRNPLETDPQAVPAGANLFEQHCAECHGEMAEGGRKAPSLLADPAFTRRNTGDNTPAMVVVELVEGDAVDVTVAAKGGGSEAKSRFAMLNPSDSVVDWVLKTLPGMGAGWCPPGMLGIGIGGTAEKAMVMAKESLMDPIDMQELIARGPKNTAEELRIELYKKINALGIGAQGLGGLTTVLDVKVKPMQLVTPPSPFVSPEAVVGMAVYTAKAMLHGKGHDVWEMVVDNIP